MIGRGWEVTFSDMLILLLTFFVFIISVSTFKSREYQEFWKNYSPDRILVKEGSDSFKFSLIEGLTVPRLNPAAEKMLLQLENQFQNSDYTGLNVIYNEHRIKLVLSDEGALFASGEARLADPAVREIIKSMIPELNRTRFLINVQGHTDSDGSDRVDNFDLSLKRALAVADLYIQNGLAPEKISVSSYGPHRPLAGNDTAEGKAFNRRVEVSIIINQGRE